ncbi:MAG: chorismate synthase [Chitinophagaceae bacterium]|nr:chorismate synthase [Chitinophagaceae bacterium]
MGNSIGNILKITTFGESHGKGIGVVLEGFPAGIHISVEEIRKEMQRRKPGQSKITTQRKEEDEVEIVSGIFEGISTGMPICMLIRNEDQKSKDYEHLANVFRPSHADYSYQMKYGIRDYRGGGRSSARETAARVAAGALIKQFLVLENIQCFAYVSQVGNIKLEKKYNEVDFSLTDTNMVRCPDESIAEQMIHLIEQTRKKRDTIGGIITGVIQGVPPGLGEPVFDKLHSDLGKAMLSINAVKGFEYGSGFAGIEMNGSEHNDIFYADNGIIKTKTNHSGGIQGGISNGEDIYFRVAFKPVATIMKDQETVDSQGNSTTVTGKGRHDPCVVPRAVPIVEAMSALVIGDHFLRNKAIQRL